MKTLYTDIDPFCCEVLRARVADGSLPPGEVVEQDVTTLDPGGFTQIHLFCGIGGIPLGLHWAGWPAEWSIVTGGFPCQDISVAGKGLGIEAGARSGLWREMHRVIDLVRPTWVLAENVPALRARGADRVLGDLEQLGYACWPLVVGAEHVGAPHRRHRVWIVGRREMDNANELRRDEQPTRRTAAKPNRNRANNGLHQPAGADVPDTLGAGCGAGSGEQGDEGRAGSGRGESAGGVQSGGLADTPGGGLGADGRARGGDGHADERGTAVDESYGGLRDGREHQPKRGEDRRTAADGTGEAGGGVVEYTDLAGLEERDAPALADRAGQRGWPMPPGPHQHPWEAPRLVESGVGESTARLPRRMAGYLRRSGLKALGNAVVPQCVEIVARGMIEFGRIPKEAE